MKKTNNKARLNHAAIDTVPLSIKNKLKNKASLNSIFQCAQSQMLDKILS